MSDSEDFHLQQVLFNVRTRRPSLALQLRLDPDSLGSSDTSTTGTTTPRTIMPDLLPPPARQRGGFDLGGILPSWIDLEHGGVRIQEGLYLKPSIDIRKKGAKLELKWTW